MVKIVEMDNNVALGAQLEKDVGPSFHFTNLQKLSSRYDQATYLLKYLY